MQAALHFNMIETNLWRRATHTSSVFDAITPKQGVLAYPCIEIILPKFYVFFMKWVVIEFFPFHVVKNIHWIFSNSTLFLFHGRVTMTEKAQHFNSKPNCNIEPAWNHWPEMVLTQCLLLALIPTPADT